MKARKILLAISFVMACELVGVLGSVFAEPAIASWYSLIRKPWFTPPGWLFVPVWVVFYFMMGMAAFWIWEAKGHKKLMPFAKSAFCWEVSFSLCWALFLFGLAQLGKAFVDIALLWISLMITIVLFYRISRKSALMLVPYLVWVTFAVALNFYIWKLN